MKKIAKLKDGTETLIRYMQEEDLEKSFRFFNSLPENDRRYLRVDVTKREIVAHRIERMLSGEVIRIVAEASGEIVGDGALELKGPGWTEHIGEMRLIIARPFQNRGLGMIMARELYFIATQRHLEKIVVQMMQPQKAAQKIFTKLGFHEKIILPDLVKDIHGQRHDLIQMSCDLEELHREIHQLFLEWDTRSSLHMYNIDEGNRCPEPRQ